jgi:hypothetical protein
MLPSAVMTLGSASDADGAMTLLPTPSACVANDGEGTESWLARRERVKLTAQNGNGMGMPLTIAVQLLPTPTAGDSKASGSRNLPGSAAHAGVSLTDAIVHGGSTNPRSDDGKPS